MTEDIKKEENIESNDTPIDTGEKKEMVSENVEGSSKSSTEIKPVEKTDDRNSGDRKFSDKKGGFKKKF